MIVWLTAAAGLGAISAFLAYAKGRSFLGWGMCGTLFGVVVVPYLLLTGSSSEDRVRRPDRYGLPAHVGFCRECGARVEAGAAVCRVCRHPLGGRPSGNPSKRETDGSARARILADVTIEEASKDPMFSRLDRAFSRLTDKPKPADEEPPSTRPAKEDIAAARSVPVEDEAQIVFSWMGRERRPDPSESAGRDREGRDPPPIAETAEPSPRFGETRGPDPSERLASGDPWDRVDSAAFGARHGPSLAHRLAGRMREGGGRYQ